MTQVGDHILAATNGLFNHMDDDDIVSNIESYLEVREL